MVDPSFSSYLSGTPMIIVNRLNISDKYQSWANSYSLLEMVVKTILPPRSLVLLKINVLSGGNRMLYSITFSSNS